VISPNDLPEYRYVGRYIGNILTTLRLALGDFSFEVLDDFGPGQTSLNPTQHCIYWLFWIIVNVFSSLIFLNFIIAEVCNCYTIIKQDIDALNYLERAQMIEEAHLFQSDKAKDNDHVKFPKYIIVRETTK